MCAARRIAGHPEPLRPGAAAARTPSSTRYSAAAARRNSHPRGREARSDCFAARASARSLVLWIIRPPPADSPPVIYCCQSGELSITLPNGENVQATVPKVCAGESFSVFADYLVDAADVVKGVLTTSGGLLSHAAASARDRGIAAVILGRAQWKRKSANFPPGCKTS